MADNELAQIAHLMRRAGFGTRPDELEACAARGYEAVVEDLLRPEDFPDVDVDVLSRWGSVPGWDRFPGTWLYRMVNTGRPLATKMALFWHHVFPTATEKSLIFVRDQIEMFHELGLSDMRTILTKLSSDPAMIMWLDNQENHRTQINENYGRELLELFSLGVGNYTEDDVKAVAHSFTGWSFLEPIPAGNREGGFPTRFLYFDEDHDEAPKSFLGESGRFNGEDVVDIIVKQPACARFISRHLYTFFVADEPQVAAWNETPPQDPRAIDILVDAYFESGGELRPILRTLFNSDFFKEARFKRVKSPAEHVAAVVKLVGTYRFPELGGDEHSNAMGMMGQNLMNPLTVEGWHTGKDWIDGGTLNERINYAVEQVSDAGRPGIKEIIERIKATAPLTPAEFVERSLALAGYVSVDQDTRDNLIESAESGGALSFGNGDGQDSGEARVLRMLQLIVSAREYQFN